MAVIWVCDGCGKHTEPLQSEWVPQDWFSVKRRKDATLGWATFLACSRACVEVASRKFELANVVNPIG